ncbi:phosphate ABC transporter ATP-binding protein PstB [Sulfobacillus thermosulfidooxidans]|uniref:Phosphate ABC transporter ATP-binding protein n=1 Tax=Sulfobacillus thermosulfidooxidans TaxID=28034 RepID=A0A1R0IL90_SULTH|nr:phosphate ABC transporter ATP-binding protein PstB [Sulfobacillus thermosulfidooxidans]OLZ10872.1 phosphate ABC transporter ATP-binding protein [Sulfobacillus thermosulfidooxidans]OLZ14360.1 phosphate ABC transporter ATP-binding protein [Sulfobacillus thermosulfidooxidans]OLZ19103.1 phosphate ABC transporter ATP-binding protein [Sulfobacillus thermosulfidooxidans]PSR28519.1 MAG: phosphate ABC transporter ATP-binding protein [Sulfobacillus thermosulfidooxidans]
MGNVGERSVPDIEVHHLSVWYGHTPALKNINLRVDAGQVLAIIGPSGCGKSTFLRVLNRMIERLALVRVEGSVRIGRFDVLDDHVDVTHLRRTVGMVFQHPNPFPMTIFDNVAYGPRIFGIKSSTQLRKTVEDSLKRAALWDEVRGKLRRSASTLSGGQQQRLCIARALAVDPQVLLLDEPTASLDPVSSAKIEELIVQLKSQYTMIIVTHNLQQAARVSDVVAFFEQGQLIEMGYTQDIFTAPREKRTEEFLTGRFD